MYKPCFRNSALFLVAGFFLAACSTDSDSTLSSVANQDEFHNSGGVYNTIAGRLSEGDMLVLDENTARVVRAMGGDDIIEVRNENNVGYISTGTGDDTLILNTGSNLIFDDGLPKCGEIARVCGGAGEDDTLLVESQTAQMNGVAFDWDTQLVSEFEVLELRDYTISLVNFVDATGLLKEIDELVLSGTVAATSIMGDDRDNTITFGAVSGPVASRISGFETRALPRPTTTTITFSGAMISCIAGGKTKNTRLCGGDGIDHFQMLTGATIDGVTELTPAQVYGFEQFTLENGHGLSGYDFISLSGDNKLAYIRGTTGNGDAIRLLAGSTLSFTGSTGCTGTIRLCGGGGDDDSLVIEAGVVLSLAGGGTLTGIDSENRLSVDSSDTNRLIDGFQSYQLAEYGLSGFSGPLTNSDILSLKVRAAGGAVMIMDSIVRGAVTGSDNTDTITISGTSRVGDIETRDGNDKIDINAASAMFGFLDGGAGSDTLHVSGTGWNTGNNYGHESNNGRAISALQIGNFEGYNASEYGLVGFQTLEITHAERSALKFLAATEGDDVYTIGFLIMEMVDGGGGGIDLLSGDDMLTLQGNAQISAIMDGGENSDGSDDSDMLTIASSYSDSVILTATNFEIVDISASARFTNSTLGVLTLNGATNLGMSGASSVNYITTGTGAHNNVITLGAGTLTFTGTAGCGTPATIRLCAGGGTGDRLVLELDAILIDSAILAALTNAHLSGFEEYTIQNGFGLSGFSNITLTGTNSSIAYASVADGTLTLDTDTSLTFTGAAGCGSPATVRLCATGSATDRLLLGSGVTITDSAGTVLAALTNAHLSGFEEYTIGNGFGLSGLTNITLAGANDAIAYASITTGTLTVKTGASLTFTGNCMSTATLCSSNSGTLVLQSGITGTGTSATPFIVKGFAATNIHGDYNFGATSSLGAVTLHGGRNVDFISSILESLAVSAGNNVDNVTIQGGTLSGMVSLGGGNDVLTLDGAIDIGSANRTLAGADGSDVLNIGSSDSGAFSITTSNNSKLLATGFTSTNVYDDIEFAIGSSLGKITLNGGAGITMTGGSDVGSASKFLNINASASGANAVVLDGYFTGLNASGNVGCTTNSNTGHFCGGSNDSITLNAGFVPSSSLIIVNAGMTIIKTDVDLTFSGSNLADVRMNGTTSVSSENPPYRRINFSGTTLTNLTGDGTEQRFVMQGTTNTLNGLVDLGEGNDHTYLHGDIILGGGHMFNGGDNTGDDDWLELSPSFTINANGAAALKAVNFERATINTDAAFAEGSELGAVTLRSGSDITMNSAGVSGTSSFTIINAKDAGLNAITLNGTFTLGAGGGACGANAHICGDTSNQDTLELRSSFSGTGLKVIDLGATTLNLDYAFAAGSELGHVTLGGGARTLTFTGITLGVGATALTGTNSGDNITLSGGTINGAVNLGTNNDTLTLSGAPTYTSASFDGGTQGSGGSDTLNVEISNTRTLTATGFEATKISSNTVNFTGSVLGNITLINGVDVDFLGGTTLGSIISMEGPGHGTSDVDNITIIGSTLSGNIDLTADDGNTTLFLDGVITLTQDITITGASGDILNLGATGGLTLTLMGSFELNVVGFTPNNVDMITLGSGSTLGGIVLGMNGNNNPYSQTTGANFSYILGETGNDTITLGGVIVFSGDAYDGTANGAVAACNGARICGNGGTTDKITLNNDFTTSEDFVVIDIDAIDFKGGNANTITFATGSGSLGDLNLLDGGAHTIIFNGTTIASIDGGAGDSGHSGTDMITITGGTVNGSVALGDGGDTLNLGGGITFGGSASFSGDDTTADSNTDTLNLLSDFSITGGTLTVTGFETTNILTTNNISFGVGSVLGHVDLSGGTDERTFTFTGTGITDATRIEIDGITGSSANDILNLTYTKLTGDTDFAGGGDTITLDGTLDLDGGNRTIDAGDDDYSSTSLDTVNFGNTNVANTLTLTGGGTIILKRFGQAVFWDTVDYLGANSELGDVTLRSGSDLTLSGYSSTTGRSFNYINAIGNGGFTLTLNGIYANLPIGTDSTCPAHFCGGSGTDILTLGATFNATHATNNALKVTNVDTVSINGSNHVRFAADSVLGAVNLLGNVNHTVTFTSTNLASIGGTGNDGVDTITIDGGTLTGAVTLGANDDKITLGGTITLTGASFVGGGQTAAPAGDRLILANDFRPMAETQALQVTGFETVTINSPHPLNGNNNRIKFTDSALNYVNLNSGTGNRLLNFIDTAITGRTIGGTNTAITGRANGEDNITIEGTSTVTALVDLGGGNDSITLTAGTISGTVNFGSGNDTLTISGGEASGMLNFGGNDDRIDISGGTLSGGVDFGAGDDTFAVAGGTVSGTVTLGTGGDTFTLKGAPTFTSTTIINGGGTVAEDVANLGADGTTNNYSGTDTFIMQNFKTLNTRNDIKLGATSTVGRVRLLRGTAGNTDSAQTFTMLGGTFGHFEGNGQNDNVVLGGAFTGIALASAAKAGCSDNAHFCGAGGTDTLTLNSDFTINTPLKVTSIEATNVGASVIFTDSDLGAVNIDALSGTTSITILGNSKVQYIKGNTGDDNIYIGYNGTADTPASESGTPSLTFTGAGITCSGSVTTHRFCGGTGNDTLIIGMNVTIYDTDTTSEITEFTDSTDGFTSCGDSSSTVMPDTGRCATAPSSSSFRRLKLGTLELKPETRKNNKANRPSPRGIFGGFENLSFEFDVQLENALIPATQSMTRQMMENLPQTKGVWIDTQTSRTGYVGLMTTDLALSLTAEAGYDEDITITRQGFNGRYFGVSTHLVEGELASGDEVWQVRGYGAGMNTDFSFKGFEGGLVATGAWFEVRAENEEKPHSHAENIADSWQMLAAAKLARPFQLGHAHVTPFIQAFWQETRLNGANSDFQQTPNQGFSAGIDVRLGDTQVSALYANEGDEAVSEINDQTYSAEPSLRMGLQQNWIEVNGLTLRSAANWTRGLESGREQGEIKVNASLAF